MSRGPNIPSSYSMYIYDMFTCIICIYINLSIFVIKSLYSIISHWMMLYDILHGMWAYSMLPLSDARLFERAVLFYREKMIPSKTRFK